MTFDLKEQMINLLEKSNAEDEWDEMPFLFVFQEDPNPSGVAVTIMGLGMDGDPVVGLHHLNAVVQRTGELRLAGPGKVVGLILCNEGWGLRSDQGITQEEMREWQQAGKRYVDHPAAVECKIFTGVQNTSSAPVFNLEVIGTGFSRHEEPDLKFGHTEGRVPDVLKELFMTFSEAAG